MIYINFEGFHRNPQQENTTKLVLIIFPQVSLLDIPIQHYNLPIPPLSQRNKVEGFFMEIYPNQRSMTMFSHHIISQIDFYIIPIMLYLHAYS